MQTIENSRYSVQGNQIWGSFTDYVVCIAQDVDPKKLEEADSIYEDDSDCWSVQFMKGNYNGAEKSPKVYFPSLESAFLLVNLYVKQKTFDSLMRKMFRDQNPDETRLSSHDSSSDFPSSVDEIANGDRSW